MSHEDDEQERPPQAETDNPSPDEAEAAADAPDSDEASAADEEAASAEASADEPAAASAETSPRARKPAWYRVGQILLPPLLAAGAVGVHWKLNVPDKILESPGDQGSKKKKKKQRKRKTGKEARERRADNRHAPRTAEQLDEAWKAWGETPFDEEPIRAPWARRHQALINRAMVVARRTVFEGAPEDPRTVLASTKCRTVRCRFVVRSPYQHELETLRGGLERMTFDEESAWRSFAAEPIEPPEGMPDEEHYLQFEVAFVSDGVSGSGLDIPPAPGKEGDEAAEPKPEGKADTPTQAALAPPTPKPEDAKKGG